MKIPRILRCPFRGHLIHVVVSIGLAVAVLAGLAGCGKSSTTSNSNPGGNQQGSAPTIASISPTHAPGSAKDTITGTGFDANNSSVSFNGQKATLVSATGTQLIVTVPSLAGTGKVTVTVGNNSVTGPLFTYDTVWTPTLVADNLTDPRHLAIDSNGTVYVAYSNTVGKINSDGTVSNFSSIGLVKPVGIAADANGNIFVGDDDINHSQYRIFRYSAPSVRDSFSSTKDFIFGLTLDHTGNLYAVTLDAASLSDVTKFSPAGIATPLVTNVGNNNGFSTGITIDGASTLYLTTSITALAFGNQKFYTISPAGSVGGYTVSGTALATDVAWSNGYLYFSSTTDSAVYRANGAGQVSLIAKGLVDPYGLVVDKKGNVYVVNFYTNTSAQGKVTQFVYR